jgi:pimeloyl-ACP methyl ester carboxylesterase
MTTDTTEVVTVRLEDGRNLEVQTAGIAGGLAVVFHHGTPGASFAPPDLVASATARGLRLVAPSRAGYGGSSRDEGRDVAAAARDVASVLDALGIERFATVGWSGGGPHALACAATLPDRCVAAISVAGVAPYMPDEFDWTEGMGEENVEEFALSLEGGLAYDEMLETLRATFLAMTPDATTTLRDLLGDLVSDVDNESASRDDVEYLFDSFARGLAPGIGGWRDDDQAFLRPWGIDVSSIRVPVGIWFGSQDLMVPERHGEWLAAHVPDARVRHFVDEGHLSLVLGKVDRLVDDLCELAGLR